MHYLLCEINYESLTILSISQGKQSLIDWINPNYKHYIEEQTGYFNLVPDDCEITLLGRNVVRREKIMEE